MAICLLIGILLGAANGVLTVVLRIPPFITTLGMTTIARGLALTFSQGEPITGFPADFRSLGAGYLRDISFELYRGEILGLAGLVGSGRTTLARTLFGVEKSEQGEIWINQQRVTIDSPQAAIQYGIGLVPEDRKAQTLFLNMAVSDNIVMSAFPKLSRAGIINVTQVRRTAQEYVNRLDIRTPSLVQRTRNLSGENQQKLAISRWLTLNPEILILDEPTRGTYAGQGLPPIAAIILAIAAGGFLGTVNGILIVSGGLPPFVATLAMLALARRLTLVYTGGYVIPAIQPVLTFLGSGQIGPVPIPGIVMFLLFGILWLVLTQTRFGLHVYAVGGNEETTRLAGVNTRTVALATYIISGLMAGVGGVIFMGHLNSAQPQVAVGIELDAIAAPVLGV